MGQKHRERINQEIERNTEVVNRYPLYHHWAGSYTRLSEDLDKEDLPVGDRLLPHLLIYTFAIFFHGGALSLSA